MLTFLRKDSRHLYLVMKRTREGRWTCWISVVLKCRLSSDFQWQTLDLCSVCVGFVVKFRIFYLNLGKYFVWNGWSFSHSGQSSSSLYFCIFTQRLNISTTQKTRQWAAFVRLHWTSKTLQSVVLYGAGGGCVNGADVSFSVCPRPSPLDMSQTSAQVRPTVTSHWASVGQVTSTNWTKPLSECSKHLFWSFGTH